MTLAREHDQLVGRSLGEFVLRERIGEGGFGAVYRAIQPALEREAVIKVLHATLHASPAAAERFLREARLASKLDHPYAAHIYAFGAERDGELWIAMELVRGTPLDQILKIQGPLSVERMVPLLDRICEVVHTAHEQGIVHRDIKPANVMVLARAGRLLPKLLDFGIAKGLAPGDTREDSLGMEATIPPQATLKEVNELARTVASGSMPVLGSTPPSLDLTQRGAIMGSPHSMAPEQWVDAGDVDARTDLYALGVLVYECLTGKPPFTGDTVMQIATAHAKQPVPSLGPKFPLALDKVIARVLAKRSAERYSDALAFAAAFRQASGIVAEAVSLPVLEPACKDVVAAAPQPIAEAVAAFEAARNPHQARDAIVQLARTVARYLGLLALACRSRVTSGTESAGVADALRTLYRRSLADKEWLDLARQLTKPWLGRRDAYPVPELIDAFHGEAAAVQGLEALLALRDREAVSDDLLEQLDKAVARTSKLLVDLGGVFADYTLAATVASGVAERWTGVRRSQRTTTHVSGKNVPIGALVLLDSDAAPVLSLAPLFQLAAPTPGAPLELFLFDGRDARGAKLVALPGGFEHHDDALWDWFRAQLSDSLHEAETEVAEERPPYRGLSAFSADDGASFFGREKLVDAFANRLKVQPLLAVVGRSGAGKSSFVQAGVIPAMPKGWRAITIRPGTSPLGALLARLEHGGFAPITRDAIEADHDALGVLLRDDAARRGPLLLVIDQLEEMFTLCQDNAERRAFAEAVSAAARTADDPVRVIFTLRDDFLVRTEQVHALRNRIAQGLQLLTVPAEEDLLRILIEPARRHGYEFEDANLPQEMVAEVADQPGALALISFTAAKLWELRDRHFKQLTRAAYKLLGGVGGALARHADITLDELPPEERALAREAFRHLVTTQNTRAVLPRKDLRQLLGGDEQADRVIEKLIGARLLVGSENESGAETIEIVHEALLVAWPRLVEWRREDAEGAHFREQLRTAATQWDQRRRARGLLWRGDALADLSRWLSRHPGPLTDLERAFTDATLADAARSRRTRRLLLAGAFAALAAVVVVLSVLNTRIAGQRRELHDNLERQFEDQGRRLVLANDPLQALAYLDKARELGATGQAHDFLVAQAVRATDGELLEVHHAISARSPRFSPDGTKLITASFDRTAKIWDAHTGALLKTLPHRDTVLRASFSPDGKLALTASFDHTAVLWDVETGAPLQTFHHDGQLWCGMFSPDGKLALTASDDDTVSVWELPSGRLRFTAHGGGAGFASCAFAPDSSLIAAGDKQGTTRLWDASTGEPVHVLQGHHKYVRAVQFSPDGARLVTASFDGTAILWDRASGQAQHVLPHQDRVNWAEFSPDGKLVVTASEDRRAMLWDATTGEKVRTLSGHTSGLMDAAFSPDGTYVVTTASDASAWLWQVATGYVVARWRGHRDVVSEVAFDATGKRAVTAADDGVVIVWDVQPQERTVWLLGHRDLVLSAEFSPDGKQVVTASNDGTARVWNAGDGRELHQLLGHSGAVVAARFSPDGTMIATGGEDGTVRVWDARDPIHARILPGTTRSRVMMLAWAPDSAQLAAASDDGYVRCWDAASAQPVFAVRGHGGSKVWSVAFSPSGDRLVTAGDDLKVWVWDRKGNSVRQIDDPENPFDTVFDPSGTRMLSVVSRQRAKIWDLASGAKVRDLVGHLGLVVNVWWSPDGTTALTSSVDGSARIWNTETGEMLAIIQHSAELEYASYSPDGTRVVIADDDGRAAIHELPRYTASDTELARLLRCRVPFEVQGDHIAPRERDLTGCAP
jgi:WD40 repeat protein/serine/threonine protein kinase